MANNPMRPADALRQGQGWAEARRLRPACTALARAAEDPALRLEALRIWSDALLTLGNAEEAAARTFEAIAFLPTHQPAWHQLEGLLLDLDQPEAAVARAALHAEASGTAEVLAAQAALEYRLGPGPRPRLRWEQAERAGPLPAASRVHWAHACLDADDAAGARAQLLLAWAAADIASLPDDKLRFLLDRLMPGPAPDAAERAAIGQAAAASGQASVRVAWGQALLRMGLPDEALTEFAQACALEPGRLSAHHGQAACLLALGDLDGAAAAVLLEDPALSELLRHPQGGDALVQRLAPRADAADPEGQWSWAQALRETGRTGPALDSCLKAMAAIGAVHPMLAETTAGTLARADAALREHGHAVAAGFSSLPSLFTWALALDWAGDATAALAAAERGLQVRPGDPALLRFAGRLQCQAGQVQDGLARWADALVGGDVQPPGDEERGVLARALSQAPADSTDRLWKAIADMPPGSPADAALWGESLLWLQRTAEALELLGRARQAWPEAPDPVPVHALALLRDGRHASAADACIGLVEQGFMPAETSPFWATFRAAAAHLDGDEAIAAMDAAVTRLDGAITLRQWALTLGWLDRLGAELRHYEAAAARRPGDATLRAEWAFRLQLAGQSDRAAAEHARAEHRAPGDDFVAYLRARALAAAQRFDEALAQHAHQSRLKGHPPDFEAQFAFDLGVALDGAGRREEAVQRYRQGLSLPQPESAMTAPYCLHNIAYIRQSQGDYRAASAAWQQALAAYDAAAGHGSEDVEPDFFNYQAVAYQFARGESSAARDLHERALQQNPRNTMALLGIVRLLVRQAEEANPTSDRQGVARLQAQAREAAARARTLIERRLKDLDVASTRMEAGQLALLRADPAAAVEHLQAAVRLEPGRAEPWLALAQARWRHGDAASALQDCLRAVTIDPESLDGRCTLGEAYRRKDDAERAEIEFRRVLSVAPGHIDARLGLGRTLAGRVEAARRDARVAEAEQLCAQALDQFALANELEGGPDGSRALSATERDNLSYLRGYLKVARYELQPESRRDASLLSSALADFGRVPPHSANHHRALRARQKINDRIKPVLSAVSWGPWIVVAAAVFTLLLANVAFLVGRPALLPTAALKSEAVAALAAASVPASALKRAEALVAEGPLPREELQKKLVAALGEPTVKAQAPLLELQTVNGQRRGWGEGIDTGYYALLNFGGLLFVVAGLYLRQLSKLKIGGIELEKTAEAGHAPAGSLDIGAPDWQLSTAAQFASTGSN